MKRLLSLLALLLLVVLAPGRAQAASGPITTSTDDTIMVKLPNQATMTLYVKNKEQLREFRAYKLDSLMRMLDMYINQAVEAGASSKTDQVTLEFKPSKDHPGTQAELVRITVRNDEPGNAKSKPKAEKVDVILGKAFGVTVVETGENEDGNHISVHVGSTPAEDSVRQVQKRARELERANRRVHQDFGIDLGVNTLVNRPTPGASIADQDYELKPLSSRYISLNWRYDLRLGSKSSPLHLITGPEVAFNNYMLDNNQFFRNDRTRQPSATFISRDTARSLEKSKLAVTSLNLPLMMELRFKNDEGKTNFRIGAGGFVGYRLSSHTKLKYEQEGRSHKDKDRDNMNLEDFQYGLQGMIGVRGLDLFVKYHLTDAFKANRGPEAQTVSFGISLLN
ncbi:outer membrane beta-barrel protein [Hymenobacter sp. BT730]|uniref:outer membrane beta-barrel protein n=1 Tax=Hymenobacter sp. BT730 TaxID=3063332 RepID=UPI0026DF482E|nr:outer membrane beta-barrel protein [Hymenobacter sp. BT730]